MINEETVNGEEMILPSEGDVSEDTVNGENEAEPVSGDDSGSTVSDGNRIFSQDPASLSRFVLPVFAIAAVIAAALFVVRHRRGGRANGTANGAGSFPMTLTMIRGKCRSKADPVYFRYGMTVGSDPKCDLCMEGSGICPVHARIILVNGQLYIEDNNTEAGVTIGGMRIQDRNPLRPGDIVGLGDVYFSLRY